MNFSSASDQQAYPRDPADRKRPTPNSEAEVGFFQRHRRQPPSIAMGTVTIVSNDGTRYAPTAAEMASVESRKTREKLRTKADHVAKFHRKVVRRLAVDKRAADSCVRGGKIINAQIKRIESFDTFGAVLESGGLTLGEEQGALWGHASPSHEAPPYQAVKVIGVRGDKSSLLDADMDARTALAAYRR